MVSWRMMVAKCNQSFCALRDDTALLREQALAVIANPTIA